MDKLMKNKFKEMIDNDQFTLEEVNHGLYCDNCHAIYEVRGSILHNITAVDTTLSSSDFSLDNIHCKKCGNLMFVLDKEISEDISLLNEKGYKTLFSCQGHSIENCSYITFDGDTSKALIEKNILPPEKWYYDSGLMYLPDEEGVYHDIETTALRSVIQKLYGDSQLLDLLGLTYDGLYKDTMETLHNWVKELPNIS
jgi:hypothetical protein